MAELKHIIPFHSLRCIALAAQAQNLDPVFHKLKDGIYTFAPERVTTTCSFVITAAVF
jgi:hypothetical protein